MYQNLKHADVVARKQHSCDWCDKAIEKGETYHYEAFKFDGEFCEWHSQGWTATSLMKAARMYATSLSVLTVNTTAKSSKSAKKTNLTALTGWTSSSRRTSCIR